MDMGRFLAGKGRIITAPECYLCHRAAAGYVRRRPTPVFTAPVGSSNSLPRENQMLIWRVKPLDLILKTAQKKALKRQLGAFQLTMLGIGAISGTGIFVLTAEAAQKAGPGMMVSFVIAGFVCAVAALCYSELASMVPVSGSAYTYTYAVMGELFAWMVGWALILEYAVGASAVAVGWSGYFVGPVSYTHLT